MKKVLRSVLFLIVLFGMVMLAFNLAVNYVRTKNVDGRTVAVNRIHAKLCDSVELADTIDENMPAWKKEFGKDAPKEIEFISSQKATADAPFTAVGEGNDIICPIYRGGELVGFARYHYEQDYTSSIRVIVNITIIVLFLITLTLFLYVRCSILDPFHRLSNYPEKIAKLPDAKHLPENKNRWFGKYIWGMNLLRDTLGRERRRNEKLECERQILVASIAHSVKTPVMNIRLYAEALNNGLTLEDGTKADIKDIAAKIDSNADRIQKIATDVINASVESVTSYEPEISEFYLRELSALINEEYAQQMELSRIPFTVECPDNPLVRSDSYGLLRIISLLLDNAVKYGDGTGITVSLSKEEEGILISVRNKGELLPEEELSFIFTSFRRGSNAVNKEGSGIGLYTAKKIATSLGGNIFARRLPESSEMEFSVYIE